MKDQHDILTHVVKKAAQGDAGAQAILYEHYARQMFNICIRMTANRNDAEDALHNAFINAFQHLYQLKSPDHFEYWLRKIIIHECLKLLKKSIQWTELNDDEIKESEENEAWYTEIPLQEIHEHIKKLPDGCREIFTLYALEDYSHHEIAQMLGCSISTSKSQYHRAKKLLRERIVKKYLHG